MIIVMIFVNKQTVSIMVTPIACYVKGDFKSAEYFKGIQLLPGKIRTEIAPEGHLPVKVGHLEIIVNYAPYKPVKQSCCFQPVRVISTEFPESSDTVEDGIELI